MEHTVTFRSHPVYIAVILRKMILLLLIPLLRSTVSALSGGWASWLSGAWFDLLLVFLFFAVGFASWFRFCISVGPRGFSIQQGVFFCRSATIPMEKCSCITAISPFYFKPIGAVRFRVDTPGGNIKKADLSLILRRKDLEAILPLLGPVSMSNHHRTKIYTPKNSYVLLLSALTSNSFAGVLMFSAFLSQTGTLLGAEFADRLYGTFEEVTRLLAFGIPPAAAAVAYTLLFGWLLAFLINAARHLNLTVRRSGPLLQITGGLLSQHRYWISRQNIGFIDIRQTLLTRILGLHSAFVSSIGYGKYRDELDAIIPCANARHLKNRLSLLLPEYQISPRQLGPKKKRRLPLPPLPYSAMALVAALCLLCLWLLSIFPLWHEFILWGFLFCLVPALWYLSVRLIDAFSCGISYQRKCYTLRYAKGFHFHTVLLLQHHISKVLTVQNPIQRFSGRCDLLIFSYTEGIRLHRIRNLPVDRALSLFQL